MFRDPQQIRRRLMEIVEKFRQKGATSPEKALTLQELDLPPRFEQAMHRRLGQTGIFIEVNGKYYLNEDRLRQIQEQRGQQEGGSGGFGGRNGNLGGRVGPPSSHRYVGVILMLPVGLIVAFVLIYVVGFGQGYFPGELLVILLVVALFMMAARLLFRRSRRQYGRGQGF
jgi:hypothetical protein